jgi:hypothetical protein
MDTKNRKSYAAYAAFGLYTKVPVKAKLLLSVCDRERDAKLVTMCDVRRNAR